MTAWGIVDATERFYRSLFTAAIGFTVAMVAWGLVIAPFNAFDHHPTRSLAVGVALAACALAALYYRRTTYAFLRRRHAGLLVAVAVSLAALWADGGWRSSYYLASYAAVALAAVVAGKRWGLLCGGLLAAGYVVGLALNGYTWSELEHLKDADSVVANTGGYLVAGYFFAAPVSWLGGYVARVHQIASNSSLPVSVAPAEPVRPPAPERTRTAALSPREIQVVQLVAAGHTDGQIAGELVVSIRTVHSHVQKAIRKVGAKNRTELAVLAVLAVREGLVPDDQLGVSPPD